MKARTLDLFEKLDTQRPVWSRFFMVAPLAVIGSQEGEEYDLAPKHMLTPMGFDNYIGFVCTPRHSTYSNVRKHGRFTVSFPKPDQTLVTGLTASPRMDSGTKTSRVLDHLPTLRIPGSGIPFLKDSYLLLECVHFKTVDGFGTNSLITGSIEKAFVHRDYLRVSEMDDSQMLRDHPLLAYVAEGRFGLVSDTYVFPFPKGFTR